MGPEQESPSVGALLDGRQGRRTQVETDTDSREVCLPCVLF